MHHFWEKMNIPPKGYNIFLRCWKVKGSVFCHQNDPKILLKKNKTEIIGEFFSTPLYRVSYPHGNATWPRPHMSTLRLNWVFYQITCCFDLKSLRKNLWTIMWIHEYISWNWQELKCIKANRRAIPRIFRNAWHSRNHAVESKSIAYLQIHRLHSSFRSI